MSKTLTIKYTGGLNEEMEDTINVILRNYGYNLTGSGMLIKEQIRDLSYEFDCEIPTNN